MTTSSVHPQSFGSDQESSDASTQVEGIAITHQLEDGQTVKLSHGSRWAKPTAIVTFCPKESLVGVFGLAGPPTSCEKRAMINSINFVILDSKTMTIRTEGALILAYSLSGIVTKATRVRYSVSDVFASGGFAESNTIHGLSGLFFYKDLN
ncbi:hypothetical protein BD309DRAFT_878170 [Dichomitus squalens]|nr:hypothetical protein BD309DRAFT_878170 [Dichomitus squalens]